MHFDKRNLRQFYRLMTCQTGVAHMHTFLDTFDGPAGMRLREISELGVIPPFRPVLHRGICVVDWVRWRMNITSADIALSATFCAIHTYSWAF
jgi:hypothetical protein